MSRARLGLYIFSRVSLFKNCFELQPAFNILTKRPTELHLCPNEVYGTNRQANVAAPNPLIIYDMPQMTKFVYDFYANKVAAMTDICKPPQISKLEDQKVQAKQLTHKVGQHPGDDRGDSDNEIEADKPVFTEIVNEVADQ